MNTISNSELGAVTEVQELIEHPDILEGKFDPQVNITAYLSS